MTSTSKFEIGTPHSPESIANGKWSSVPKLNPGGFFCRHSFFSCLGDPENWLRGNPVHTEHRVRLGGSPFAGTRKESSGSHFIWLSVDCPVPGEGTFFFFFQLMVCLLLDVCSLRSALCSLMRVPSSERASERASYVRSGLVLAMAPR